MNGPFFDRLYGYNMATWNSRKFSAKLFLKKMTLFVEKYKPKRLEEVIGNNNSIKKIMSWVKTFKTQKKRGCFVWGSHGIGKTISIHLICQKENIKIINYENKKDIETQCKIISTKERKSCLVIDEVENVSIRGFQTYIREVITKTKIPIIIIGNDNPNYNKYKSLKNVCEIINFKKPSYFDVYPKILNICRIENKNYKEADIRHLYDKSNGDIRFILTQIQSEIHKIEKTNITLSIFDEAAILFKRELSFNETLKLNYGNNNLNSLFMHENYLKYCNNSKMASNISDYISLSDKFEKVIQITRDYSIKQYHDILSTVIPSMKIRNPQKTYYLKFPSILGKISTTNKNKRLKKNMDIEIVFTNYLNKYDREYEKYMKGIKTNKKKISNLLKKKHLDMKKLPTINIDDYIIIRIEFIDLVKSYFKNVDEWNLIGNKKLKVFKKHNTFMKNIFKSNKRKRKKKSKRRKRLKN